MNLNSNLNVPQIAYILQIHKNAEQVNKFIKQILPSEGADIFVHIDKKNYDQLSDKILKNPRVVILRECIDITWGDITQIDATILLLKEVLATGKHYEYVCFRSGQDLLVKNGLFEYLMENKNKIFLDAHYVDKKEPQASFVNVKWPKATRRLYINPFHPYRLFRRAIALMYGKGINLLPIKKALPENFSIYEGSNWFCIPLKVSQYIIDFLNDNRWFYAAFKDGLAPDQFFIQTLIMNSQYKDDVVNNNLMYIKFGETLKTRNNPIILKMEHIDLIKASNEYFARKFDENIDRNVVDYFANEVRM